MMANGCVLPYHSKFYIMEQKKKFDLEDRLVDYAVNMIEVVEALPETRVGNYISALLIGSSLLPSFNYAEVNGAPSRAAFINSMGILMKQLKESRNSLKIIERRKLLKDDVSLDHLNTETEALIAIIGKSISTAKSNKKKEVAGVEAQ